MKKTPLKRTGFRSKSLEEIKEAQTAKLQEKIEKVKKQRQDRKVIMNRKRLEAKKAGEKAEKKPKAKLKKDRIKSLKKKLQMVCHTSIRKRDSDTFDRIAGFCFDCGEWAEGQHFQAGHFHPSGACGALLRYHPHNIHGQASGCNMKVRQETVKIKYTRKMIERYGIEYVDKLNSMLKKSSPIDADEQFYLDMIEMYERDAHDEIVEYLEKLSTV